MVVTNSFLRRQKKFLTQRWRRAIIKLSMHLLSQKRHMEELINMIYASCLPACLLDFNLQMLHKGLQTLVCYTKTSYRLVKGVIDEAKSSIKVRFYISSLPFNPETLNQIKFSILDYWSIESSYHGPLDNKRLFDQDSIQSCNENYLGNSITLNKLALSLIHI